MIHFCRTNGEQLYWLTCDNCHDFTEQYEDEEELRLESQGKGWQYNTTLHKHFCTLACELEFLARLAKVVFRPVPDGGDGSLPGRGGEDARGVSCVDGVVHRQSGECLMK